MRPNHNAISIYCGNSHFIIEMDTTWLVQRESHGVTVSIFVICSLCHISFFWYPVHNVEFNSAALNRQWISQIARFTWPTWGPHGSCRPQVGSMWAPWTLLSGAVLIKFYWPWGRTPDMYLWYHAERDADASSATDLNLLYRISDEMIYPANTVSCSHIYLWKNW